MMLRFRLLLPLAASGLLAACATPAAPPQVAVTPEAGAQIWRATCNACHNLRPPDEFTPAEWPIIVRHMRTRAGLTREETEAVSAFLQRMAAQAG